MISDRGLTARRWIYGFAYLGVTVFIMLWHLVPLSIQPGKIPGPDLIVCVTFAWILRRPHYLPAPLVALIFFMTDLVFMRPLGLWTALILISTEFLRAREHSTREQPFPLEWAMVAGVLLAVTLAYRIVLTIFFVDTVSLGLVLVQYIATVAAYPLVVFVSRHALQISKMTPNQTDAQGNPR